VLLYIPVIELEKATTLADTLAWHDVFGTVAALFTVGRVFADALSHS
jgi:hypothetical protein